MITLLPSFVSLLCLVLGYLPLELELFCQVNSGFFDLEMLELVTVVKDCFEKIIRLYTGVLGTKMWKFGG